MNMNSPENDISLKESFEGLENEILTNEILNAKQNSYDPDYNEGTFWKYDANNNYDIDDL